MSEPTDHEVNVRLAEFMKVEPCAFYHKRTEMTIDCIYAKGFQAHCQYCDEGYMKYTESLDLVREVELTFRGDKCKERDYESTVDVLVMQGLDQSSFMQFDFITATANQRARACLKVIEEVGK